MDRWLPLLPAVSLRLGRVHEVTGDAAPAFVAVVLSRVARPGLWIAVEPARDVPHPDGLRRLGIEDPGLQVVTADRTDALWAAEEALRCPSGPTVIARLSRPLDLTSWRRLQLAAESGGGLGLFLLPEGPGATAAETRWRCTALSGDGGPDSTLWRWSLIKNRKGTLGAWEVSFDAATNRLHVVAAPADGPFAEGRTPLRGVA